MKIKVPKGMPEAACAGRADVGDILKLDKWLPVLPFSDHDSRVYFDWFYERLVRREGN